VAGTENSDGDTQKALDVQCDEIIEAALADVPVAYYASEERDDIITLDKDALLAVASDPLDGSSNVDTNVSIGTIFSIYENGGSAEKSFFRPGTDQMVGGFFIYGPQTTLVITTGEGTELYVLDRDSRTFKLAIPAMQIAETSNEFAINASNYEHWEAPMRAYIDDCLKGADGPFKKKQGMRWIGSLVADANRILMRGGIFAYPADDRKGYEQGRLRMLYEAHPVAFVIEQAGGMASDGRDPILDKTLTSLHERVPFVFGSVDTVQTIVDYHKKN
jgi:fructose-1,6-bisphosphatase I